MERKEPAKDKLHDSNLGKVKDVNALSFDKDTNSYEFDVKGEEHRYNHPSPYQTSAPNGEDSISTYDESNPFIAQEASFKGQMDEPYEEMGMRIEENEDSLRVDTEDEILSRTVEDARTDLDEEGYPINKYKKK